MPLDTTLIGLDGTIDRLLESVTLLFAHIAAVVCYKMLLVNKLMNLRRNVFPCE